MATTLTTPTTVYISERPHPHVWSWIWWQLPLLPQLPSVFLERPHPHSVFILCAWYTIWVLILIKSIVLSLFLAFIILSDLYYPHHPPTEGCKFRSRKKGILYIQPQSRFSRQRSLRSSFRPEVTGVTKPTGLYTPATFPRRFWWVKILRRASSTFPETTYGSTPL